MKQLLLVLFSSAALTAWGQTSLAPDKSAAADNANARQTLIVRGIDGNPHQFDVPNLSELLERRAQDGCPVQILNASFDRPAELVLTAQTKRDTGPTLHLNYENSSGKDIDSVVLTGWLKVKESPLPARRRHPSLWSKVVPQSSPRQRCAGGGSPEGRSQRHRIRPDRAFAGLLRRRHKLEGRPAELRLPRERKSGAGRGAITPEYNLRVCIAMHPRHSIEWAKEEDGRKLFHCQSCAPWKMCRISTARSVPRKTTT